MPRGHHPHGMSFLALSLVWLACLLPSVTAQAFDQPTRSPTYSPTRTPTMAPKTVYCNMTAYQNASAGAESCTTCRNTNLCAWCLPNSGRPGYCFNNVEGGCVEGTTYSYSDDICDMGTMNISPSIIAIPFIVILLCCCCAGACFWARRRRSLMTSTTNGGITVIHPANMAPAQPMQQHNYATHPGQQFNYPPNYPPQQPTYPGQQPYYPPQQPVTYPAHTYYVQQAPPTTGMAPASPPPGVGYGEPRYL